MNADLVLGFIAGVLQQTEKEQTDEIMRDEAIGRGINAVREKFAEALPRLVGPSFDRKGFLLLSNGDVDGLASRMLDKRK